MQMSAISSIHNRTLWDEITETYRNAQKDGAAYKFATRIETIEDCGFQFIVRIAESLRDKAKAATGR